MEENEFCAHCGSKAEEVILKNSCYIICSYCRIGTNEVSNIELARELWNRRIIKGVVLNNIRTVFKNIYTAISEAEETLKVCCKLPRILEGSRTPSLSNVENWIFIEDEKPTYDDLIVIVFHKGISMLAKYKEKNGFVNIFDDTELSPMPMHWRHWREYPSEILKNVILEREIQ